MANRATIARAGRRVARFLPGGTLLLFCGDQWAGADNPRISSSMDSGGGNTARVGFLFGRCSGVARLGGKSAGTFFQWRECADMATEVNAGNFLRAVRALSVDRPHIM